MALIEIDDNRWFTEPKNGDFPMAMLDNQMVINKGDIQWGYNGIGIKQNWQEWQTWSVWFLHMFGHTFVSECFGLKPRLPRGIPRFVAIGSWRKSCSKNQLSCFLFHSLTQKPSKSIKIDPNHWIDPQIHQNPSWLSIFRSPQLHAPARARADRNSVQCWIRWM